MYVLSRGEMCSTMHRLVQIVILEHNNPAKTLSQTKSRNAWSALYRHWKASHACCPELKQLAAAYPQLFQDALI